MYLVSKQPVYKFTLKLMILPGQFQEFFILRCSNLGVTYESL
jgi:hypothetical protein